MWGSQAWGTLTSHSCRARAASLASEENHLRVENILQPHASYRAVSGHGPEDARTPSMTCVP